MKKISDLISSKIGNSALQSSQVISLKVCNLWQKVINNISPKFKDETKAASFRSGKLLIKVCSASQMFELQMKEIEIIDEYKKILNQDLVKRVVYKVD